MGCTVSEIRDTMPHAGYHETTPLGIATYLSLEWYAWWSIRKFEAPYGKVIGDQTSQLVCDQTLKALAVR